MSIHGITSSKTIQVSGIIMNIRNFSYTVDLRYFRLDTWESEIILRICTCASSLASVKVVSIITRSFFRAVYRRVKKMLTPHAEHCAQVRGYFERQLGAYKLIKKLIKYTARGKNITIKKVKKCKSMKYEHLMRHRDVLMKREDKNNRAVYKTLIKL